MILKHAAVPLIVASLLMSGCSTKQNTGMLAGGAGGAAGCAMLTKDSPGWVRLGATVGCGVIGLVAGSSIGKYFDDDEKADLDAKASKAARSSDASVTTYKSRSGATARVEVGKSSTRSETTTVQRSTAVQNVPTMTKLDEAYVTLKGANVRSAPSTKGTKLAFLPAQTEFKAIGQAGSWIAVSQKGSLVGYVSQDLVQSKSSLEAKLAERLATPGETKPRIEPTYVPALKLDDATPETRPELSKVIEQPVVTEKVQTTTTCKTIKTTVTGANGKAEPTDSKEICKKSPAEDAWDNA